MSRPIITVENLGKKYRLNHQAERQRYTALRDVIADKAKRLFRPTQSQNPRTEEFWALKGVSFEVNQGDVVGIVGRNGAGKSTLLKILSRITEPTTGRVHLRGRVASLLEVGTGFHPELTGRENIYLNGAILGMTRAEIRAKFDEIVNFAEVQGFVDTPVKRYSSGMYVRLAFAVAAHLEPEILIVDEVLAVGDAGFQEKCLGRMGEVAQKGRTVFFVSHNMWAVNSLTHRALLMDKGEIVQDGPTAGVVRSYLSYFGRTSGGKERRPRVASHRRGRSQSGVVEFVDIWIEPQSEGIAVVDISAPFVLAAEIYSRIELRGAEISVEIKKTDGSRVLLAASVDTGFNLSAPAGRHVVRCVIQGFSLPPGQYLVDLGIAESLTALSWDVIMNYPLFETVDLHNRLLAWPDRPWGAIHCDTVSWNITPVQISSGVHPTSGRAVADAHAGGMRTGDPQGSLARPYAQ